MTFFRFNFEKKVVRMSGMFPEIQMVCDYEVKVKILVLNIHGIGNSTVILSKFFAFFDFSDDSFGRKP